MQQIISIGFNIFNRKDYNDFSLQRLFVFIIRSSFNKNEVFNLIDFFSANELLNNIALKNPTVYEQLTRYLFYSRSSLDERLTLIKNHFLFITNNFTPAAINNIYNSQPINLLSYNYNNDQLKINLNYKYEDRKEGIITIELTLNDERIYHITFWFNLLNNTPIICIGALQGKKGASELIHALTKHFHGYRPKNLILLSLRCIADALNITNIYAVSNRGFYTNNHVRVDKKLKTSLDDFWTEAGGKICPDERFYELPIEEFRKDITEVKTHKRNLYRKRYDLLDTLILSIKNNLTNFLK